MFITQVHGDECLLHSVPVHRLAIRHQTSRVSASIRDKIASYGKMADLQGTSVRDGQYTRQAFWCFVTVFSKVKSSIFYLVSGPHIMPYLEVTYVHTMEISTAGCCSFFRCVISVHLTLMCI